MFACIRRDHRWDWAVDERAVYLARLVRDLELPVGRLVDLLREQPDDNDGNTFDNTLEVLEALGRAGDPTAAEAAAVALRWAGSCSAGQPATLLTQVGIGTRAPIMNQISAAAQQIHRSVTHS